jgi:putative aminopeptidase FrvX
MAAVGPGQNSDEFSACICIKDSGGPYHPDMNRKLVRLAQEARIPYKTDIYPCMAPTARLTGAPAAMSKSASSAPAWMLRTTTNAPTRTPCSIPRS